MAREGDKYYVKRMMKAIRKAKKSGNHERAERLAQELAEHMDLYSWYDDEF